MSFFTSHSSAYPGQPFSYSIYDDERRGTPLSRVGTRLWDTLVHRHHFRLDGPSTSNEALHDMALTAQPPVLKRNLSARRRRRHANETAVSVVEEVLVGLAFAVAAGLLTRYVATVVRGLFAPSSSSSSSSSSDETTTKPSSSTP